MKIRFRALYFLSATALLLCLACNNLPSDVKISLSKMKVENREKFEKVFDHFSQPNDSLKLKAAYFLVENMNELGYYKGRQIEDYNVVFDILANKPADYRENLPWYSDELTIIFDSLKNIYGTMDFKNFYFVKDEDAVSAEYLIEYINQAFEAWNSPWSKNVVSFSDFCNYVLPYRNFKEPIEPWHAMFREKFKWINDSVAANDDIIDVARKLNVNSELKFSNGFGNYIVSIAPSMLLKAMYGDCSNSSNYKAMIMRSNGIPVAIDYMPQYGSDHNIHFWNSIMDRNGNFISFEEALNDINAFVAYKYKISKVYRKTFSINKDIEALINKSNGNVPPTFQDPRFIDVTSHYVAVTDVNLKLKNVPAQSHYVFVGVFNIGEWKLMDYAKITNGNSAKFTNLGRDVLYMPFYYIKNQLVAASLPFIISKKGYVQYIDPKKDTTTITLTRKYHWYQNKANWLQCLKGARFEGANRADFSDAVTLAKITKVPGEHFEQLVSQSKQHFNYLRMVFSQDEKNIAYDGDGASIAEIEFITPTGKIISGKPIGTPGRKYNTYTAEKCFDGRMLTFFEDARPNEKNKYVGLQLANPLQVSKIRFVARNDMNSVQKGNTYELYYWDNAGFKSLGKKIADDTLVRFNNVPKNAVLWLRNLTEGKEERIFTWDGNKQVWW